MSQVPTFGSRLAALLDLRGVSQMELATRIGVTRAAVSRYVNDEREPRYATLLRIAEELDVHVTQLLENGNDDIRFLMRLVAREDFTDAQRKLLKDAIESGLD